MKEYERVNMLIDTYQYLALFWLIIAAAFLQYMYNCYVIAESFYSPNTVALHIRLLVVNLSPSLDHAFFIDQLNHNHVSNIT